MPTEQAVLTESIERAVTEMRKGAPDSPSSAMVPSPNAMVPLRELQLLLNPIIFSDISSSEKFTAFFLNGYINTVFMDLLGDIPDDYDNVLFEVRSEFFTELVKNLDELLSQLKNDEEPIVAFKNLISSYSKAVNKLNYKDLQMGGRK